MIIVIPRLIAAVLVKEELKLVCGLPRNGIGAQRVD